VYSRDSQHTGTDPDSPSAEYYFEPITPDQDPTYHPGTSSHCSDLDLDTSSSNSSPASDPEETVASPRHSEDSDFDHNSGLEDHSDQQLSVSNPIESDSDTLDYERNLQHSEDLDSVDAQSNHSRDADTLSAHSDNESASHSVNLGLYSGDSDSDFDADSLSSGPIFRSRTQSEEGDSEFDYSNGTTEESDVQVDLRSDQSGSVYSDLSDPFTPTVDFDASGPDIDLWTAGSRTAYYRRDPYTPTRPDPYTPTPPSDTSARDSDMYVGEYELMDSDSDVQIMATPDTAVVADSDIESLSDDSDLHADAQVCDFIV
jgi:hypothetical protein